MKKVKEGYKMTELGVIPNEWSVESLDECSNVTKLAGFEFTEYMKYIDDGEVIALRALNLKNGKLDLQDIKKIDRLVSESLTRSKLYINDVLFSYVGTVGEVALIEENDKFHLAPNVAKITFNDLIFPKFALQYLMSSNIKNEINKYVTTTSQSALSMENIRKMKIIVPTKKEQEKIASILSTVDEQIDNVDELIQKNKELKKGLMQQLLTKGIGHTKFKKTDIGEIPEEWEVIKLNECGYIFGGNAFKSSSFTTEDKEDNYQVIRMGNVQLGKLDLNKNPVFLSNELVGEKEKRYLLSESDVLISLTGTVNKTDYGNISWVDKNNKYLLNQRVGCLRNTNREFNNRYYYYFLQSNIFRNQFFECGFGGTGNQSNVSIADLNNIKVLKLPIREQEKIASILLAADKRIEEYEDKKKKLEELKKGLMQQLLNGKIRVC